MTASKNIGVILCGGLGERFWPLSDETRPKYALAFTEKKTLLAATYARLRRIYPSRSIYVITAREHAALVKKLLPALPAGRILSEPSRRNTAGAVTLATMTIARIHGANAVLSFYPADAMVRDTAGFARTMKKAQAVARAGRVIALVGVRPTYPATGYGYIESGAAEGGGSAAARRVKRFVEKPPAAVARRLFKAGRFFWNAGIFTWKASVFTDEMRIHAPGYFRPFDKAFVSKLPAASEIRKIFKPLPAVAIDRLLMEKTRRLAVLPASFDWDDVGTWESLRRIAPDSKGNVLKGDGVFEDVENSVIYSEGFKIAACGLRDVVIAQNGPYLLVCGPGKAQEIPRLKNVILRLRRGRRISK